MKLSNFTLDRTEGTSAVDTVYFASVDVTTGWMWRKKTERRPMVREYGHAWHFVDTAELVPEYAINRLAKAWTKKTGQAC